MTDMEVGSERAGERGGGGRRGLGREGGTGKDGERGGGAIPAIASLMQAIVQCGRLHDDDTGDTTHWPTVSPLAGRRRSS